MYLCITCWFSDSSGHSSTTKSDIDKNNYYKQQNINNITIVW